MDSPVDPDPRSRALKEAIERQAATAEILEIIASSPTGTRPVFDAIVRGGLRLFADAAISIALPDGDKIRAAAVAEHDAARAEAWRNRFPFPLHRDYMHGIAILDAKILDIADVANAPPDVAVGAQNFLASGYRAITIMPMMRGDAAIGALSVVRRAVGPLSDEQLALLKTFAAQAVIAIENTRLLTELRQRTDDLSESLEQQTATSEVLQVISSSPGQLQPVFDMLVDSAARICRAECASIFRLDGGTYHLTAVHGFSEEYRQFARHNPIPPGRNSVVGRTALEGRTVHIPDCMSDAEYNWFQSQEIAGFRTVLGVPLLYEGAPIGVITLTRSEVRPFTDKQIDLVQNFASQAVIAIENVRLFDELRQRTDDLSESLEQQTAISDILRVISNSPGDVTPVFEAVARHAARICEAQFADIIIDNDGMILNAANVGALGPMVPGVPVDRTTFMGRSICDKQTLHVPDLQSPDLDFPLGRQLAIKAGARTALAVPLIRDDRALGTILVRRTEVRPFEDKHIALLKTFADQAAIAIENARLLNELRQRTGDLTESLEQQTATSEVLKVISSSPGELEPVFDAMLANAMRICEAKFGNLFLFDGEGFLPGAMHNAPPEFSELFKDGPYRAGPDTGLGRVASTKQVIHIPDISAEQAYADRDPLRVATVEILKARSFLSVPMLKDNDLVGAITIYRQEVRPFTEKQIELVQNFAAQAVIAIENTRLLTELRQRTDDLSESLEQQTATSEVLRVISSSPGELEPVFQTMMANATRICEASYGVMLLREGENLRAAAIYGALPTAFTEQWRSGTLFRPDSGILAFRAAATREPVQIADIRASPAYQSGNAMAITGGDVAGIRTMVTVPMLKDNEAVGVIGIYRKEVRPFTDKQIELVTNFAAQAVIAIENTRLLNELRQRTDDLSESLEQQTATSEVLRVISSSPGELEPVFQTMLESAVRICDAKFGSLYLSEGEMFRLVQTFGLPPQLDDELHRLGLRRPSPHMALGQLAQSKRTIHVPDALAVLESAPVPAGFTGPTLAKLAGARTLVVVPMLKDNALIGAIIVYRQEVRPFTDKQIELVQNFAAQAVIAIENARLLNAVREQAGQLEAQSQELRTLNQQLEQRVDEQVGEIERMSRLRRFLPPQVADLIVSSGAEKQLESHRREITALFCDLRGFTGFSETSDPEDVMALLREYHKAIGEIIFRHGGTLERFAGDGVMVIFGDPVPLPNPALSAVQMALEMRAAIGALIEKWSRLGHELGFGIGLAHGYATLGTIGFEGRFDYAAIGTVSNVASRLCDEAQPGQILVSPRVLLAVENAVSVEPVAEMTLKGIRRPMLVHNVVGVTTGTPVTG